MRLERGGGVAFVHNMHTAFRFVKYPHTHDIGASALQTADETAAEAAAATHSAAAAAAFYHLEGCRMQNVRLFISRVSTCLQHLKS